MFDPISGLPYRRLAVKGQAIAIVSTLDEATAVRWVSAAALLRDCDAVPRDVIRDLLANPHVRSLVFEDGVACREAFSVVWEGQEVTGIDQEHSALVRSFVDLYDGDYAHHGPQPPFWPLRIKYLS